MTIWERLTDFASRQRLALGVGSLTVLGLLGAFIALDRPKEPTFSGPVIVERLAEDVRFAPAQAASHPAPRSLPAAALVSRGALSGKGGDFWYAGYDKRYVPLKDPGAVQAGAQRTSPQTGADGPDPGSGDAGADAVGSASELPTLTFLPGFADSNPKVMSGALASGKAPGGGVPAPRLAALGASGGATPAARSNPSGPRIGSSSVASRLLSTVGRAAGAIGGALGLRRIGGGGSSVSGSGTGFAGGGAGATTTAGPATSTTGSGTAGGPAIAITGGGTSAGGAGGGVTTGGGGPTGGPSGGGEPTPTPGTVPPPTQAEIEAKRQVIRDGITFILNEIVRPIAELMRLTSGRSLPYWDNAIQQLTALDAKLQQDVAYFSRTGPFPYADVAQGLTDLRTQVILEIQPACGDPNSATACEFGLLPAAGVLKGAYVQTEACSRDFLAITLQDPRLWHSAGGCRDTAMTAFNGRNRYELKRDGLRRTVQEEGPNNVLGLWNLYESLPPGPRQQAALAAYTRLRESVNGAAGYLARLDAARVAAPSEFVTPEEVAWCSEHVLGAYRRLVEGIAVFTKEVLAMGFDPKTKDAISKLLGEAELAFGLAQTDALAAGQPPAERQMILAVSAGSHTVGGIASLRTLAQLW